MSAQITPGDLQKWWNYAASFSGPENPFVRGGGHYVNRNQPADAICLTSTGDRDPGNDGEDRGLPAIGNRPILIAVFVAGAATQADALAELGNNVIPTVQINKTRREAVRLDSVVHGISFPLDNPFNEPARNNKDYYSVGFWFKIPPQEVNSVNEIEFGGRSSTFSTGARYKR